MRDDKCGAGIHLSLHLSAAETPIDTCISRDTFQKLPLELQVEYAIHYKIPNAENLAAEDICAALCTNNEWIPALEGHLSLSTSNGLVVANNVMDLVDWLVAEQTEERVITSGAGDLAHGVNEHEEEGYPNSRLSPVKENEGPTIDELLPEWLLNIAEDLLRHYEQTKARNAEVRLIAREVAADVFELQARLANQLSSHSSFIHVIQGIVDDQVTREVEDHVKSMIDGLGTELRDDKNPENVGKGQNTFRKPLRKNSCASLPTTSDNSPIRKSERLGRNCPPASMPDHDSMGPPFLSAIPPTFRVNTGDLASSTLPTSYAVQVPFKRPREDDDHSHRERSHPTPLPTRVYDQISYSGHPRKRPRLETEVGSSPGSEADHMGSNSSGGNSIGDSSYLPSSGTVSSVMGELELNDAIREQWELGEHNISTADEITGEESPVSSDNGVPWSAYHACETDKTDSDYAPPPWTREDLMDLENAYMSHIPWFWGTPMDDYNAMEEAFLCGPMSDSGLTADASDAEYHDTSTVQYSKKLRSKDLGKQTFPPGNRVSLHAWGFSDPEIEAEHQARYVERRKLHQWSILQESLKDPEFVRCDVNGRVSEILTSKHRIYDFNNNSDWRWFEKSGL